MVLASKLNCFDWTYVWNQDRFWPDELLNHSELGRNSRTLAKPLVSGESKRLLFGYSYLSPEQINIPFTTFFGRLYVNLNYLMQIYVLHKTLNYCSNLLDVDHSNVNKTWPYFFKKNYYSFYYCSFLRTNISKSAIMQIFLEIVILQGSTFIKNF